MNGDVWRRKRRGTRWRGIGIVKLVFYGRTKEATSIGAVGVRVVGAGGVDVGGDGDLLE